MSSVRHLPWHQTASSFVMAISSDPSTMFKGRYLRFPLRRTMNSVAPDHRRRDIANIPRTSSICLRTNTAMSSRYQVIHTFSCIKDHPPKCRYLSPL